MRATSSHVLVAAVTACVLVLPGVGCGDRGSDQNRLADAETGNIAAGVYDGHGVRFRFPPRWEQGVGSATGPGILWKVSVGYPGTRNFVSVTAFEIGRAVTASNIDRLRRQIDEAVRAGAAEYGGDVVRGPLPAALGGLPGYEWQLVFPGDGQRTRWVYGYDERTLYYVECSADTGDAGDADAGCEQVVDTFALTRAD